MIISHVIVYYIDNLGKIFIDQAEYTVGDTIPNWEKYKYHLGTFRIRPGVEQMTVQIQVAGFSSLYFNDNRISISIRVNSDGSIIASGSSNYVKYSGISDLYMWN